MGKNSRKQAQQSAAVKNGNTNNKAQLEQRTAIWHASFKNASKVFKDTDADLDIAIDEIDLQKVIKHIHGDDEQTVIQWIKRFSEICKELGDYRDRLNNEYDKRWAICNKKSLELEQQIEAIEARENKNTDLCQRLKIQEQEIAGQRTELTSLKNELLAQERELKNREINAKNGFTKQNEQSLMLLEQQQYQEEKRHKEAMQTLRDKESELKDQMRNMADKLDKLRNTFTDEEYEKKRAFEQKSRELKRLEQLLEETAELQKQEWDDLKKAKENINIDLQEEMGRERESHQEEINRLNEKLDNAWNIVDEKKDLLSDFEELRHALGEQAPKEFLTQQTELKQEIHELKRTLAESDSAALVEDNAQLRHRVNELENDINNMRPKLLRAQTEAAHKRIAATELRAVEQEKRVLELHKNTLSVHIEDLETRIEQLTDANKAQTPFPAMSIMDTHKDFRATMELEEVPDLVTFAKELKHRIARAEKVKLYYPIEDIRVLLGGLAMSQLHVFQGISGTGKTSLAKAFAKAMGGFCTDIAVQAGWRDRDDLLGHYNAFERKFYEKDCLQALYQAQTPRWSDTCNVILLDEMNLSRPEQYFSEFLSALEKNDHNERLISLAETAVPNAPSNLKDGRQILVPRNVWFIGTANHDETTNELADKTYDRSHVMTLPKQDDSFETIDYGKANFSFNSLQNAFKRASETYKSDVEAVLENLTNHSITEQLASSFGLGWGNRFERQAKRFIPVMLACGATKGDALDHLLSTRVMRSGKVTDRYDVSAEDIGLLTDELEDFWVTCKLDSDPTKSLALLTADRQRKERGG